jgi:hypothetical protein
MAYVWNSTGCDLNTTMVENMYLKLIESTHVGACRSNPHIDRDKNRFPKQIWTYRCGDCHDKHCSKQGDFSCQEIIVRIIVEVNQGRRKHKKAKSFPAGCVCMSHLSVPGRPAPEPLVYVT